MRSRILAFAVAAVALLGASAGAQQPAQNQFTFSAGSGINAFGVQVGPYTGLEGYAPSQSSVYLYCVDYSHHVTVGEVWVANIANIGTGAGIGTTTRDVASDALDYYRAAAYLTSRYSDAGLNNADIANIQATIWDMFQPGTIASGSFLTTGTKSSDYWGAEALAHYATFDASGYYVVTDVNKSSSGSAQEFIIHTPTTSTPEPATLVLMGTGLLGVMGARVRRKKS